MQQHREMMLKKKKAEREESLRAFELSTDKLGVLANRDIPIAQQGQQPNVDNEEELRKKREQMKSALVQHLKQEYTQVEQKLVQRMASSLPEQLSAAEQLRNDMAANANQHAAEREQQELERREQIRKLQSSLQ